jgi:predicted nuclease of predicted toxin-antitoxin system
VTLLFDQNLSRRLPAAVALAFPNALHASTLGFETSDDRVIWEYARERNLTLVTKDNDFQALALTRGAPPKVIMVALGNCTTADVIQLLLVRQAEIERFEASAESLLVLGSGERS